MKKVNVFTHYDSNNRPIAQIIPRENRTNSERTYRKLLRLRTVGGIAGIYTDAGFDILVISDDGRQIATI